MSKASSDTNPYSPLTSGGNARLPVTERESSWKLALGGAVVSIVSAFPIAALFALVFRFPIPFAGYRSGVEAMVPAMLALFIYGVMLGGLLLLGALGALGGFIVASFSKAESRSQKRMVCLLSLASTSACLFVLTVLDWIVGPW